MSAREALRAQFPDVSQRTFQKLWNAFGLLSAAGMTPAQIQQVLGRCTFANKRLNAEKFLAVARSADGHPESLLKRRGRVPLSVDRLLLQSRVIECIRANENAITLPDLHSELGIPIRDEKLRRIVLDLTEKGLLTKIDLHLPQVYGRLPAELSGVAAIVEDRAVSYVAPSLDMENDVQVTGVFRRVYLEFCPEDKIFTAAARWVHQLHPPRNLYCACGYYRNASK